MELNLENLAGIYCLTSPSGSVYVGQAVNLQRRMNEYKNLHCKGQTRLLRSLQKHTFAKFKVEFLFTCNFNDFEREILKDLLNDLETEFIIAKNSFIDWNSKGMNLTTGGVACIFSKESIAKISEFMKGKPKSEKQKAKISEAMKGKLKSEKQKAKISEAMKGNQNGLGNQSMLGKTHSESTKAKISANNGMKNNPEVVAKIKATRKANQLQKYNEKVQRLKKLDLSIPLQVERISGLQQFLF